MTTLQDRMASYSSDELRKWRDDTHACYWQLSNSPLPHSQKMPLLDMLDREIASLTAEIDRREGAA